MSDHHDAPLQPVRRGDETVPVPVDAPAARPAAARARLSTLAGSTQVRYLVAGGSAFVVDFGLLALLHEVAGLPVWLASGLAFVASFAYTYTIQRLAFSTRAPHGSALVRYTTLVVVNTVATSVIVELVSWTAAGWEVGKVVATVTTTVWNYFIYRNWVFPGGPPPQEED